MTRVPRFIRLAVAKFGGYLKTPWDWTGPSPTPQMIGWHGEAVATRYLWCNGCRILYRNYDPGDGGEIDIVVRDGNTLAFVEVKTRSSEDFGRPADAVDLKKRAYLSLASVLGWPSLTSCRTGDWTSWKWS